MFEFFIAIVIVIMLLSALKAILKIIAFMLITLMAASDLFFNAFPSVSPPISWAITGFIFASLLHFSLYHADDLNRPLLKKGLIFLFMIIIFSFLIIGSFKNIKNNLAEIVKYQELKTTEEQSSIISDNRTGSVEKANKDKMETITAVVRDTPCWCGNHAGSFEAVYQNRNLTVNYSFNPNSANPIAHPVTVTAGENRVTHWDALLCSSRLDGGNSDTCPLANQRLEINGYWVDRSSFAAQSVAIVNKEVLEWNIGKPQFDLKIAFMAPGNNSGTIISVNRCALGEGDRRTCYDLVIRSSMNQLMQASCYANVPIFSQNKQIFDPKVLDNHCMADKGNMVDDRVCRYLAPGNKVDVEVEAFDSDPNTITSINLIEDRIIGICVEGQQLPSTTKVPKEQFFQTLHQWDVRWEGVTHYLGRDDPLTMTLHRTGGTLEGVVQRHFAGSKTPPLLENVRGTIKSDGSFILWSNRGLVWRGAIQHDNTVKGVFPNAAVREDGSSVQPQYDKSYALHVAMVLTPGSARLKKEEGERTSWNWAEFVFQFRRAIERQDIGMLGRLMADDLVLAQDADNKTKALAIIKSQPTYWKDLKKTFVAANEKKS